MIVHNINIKGANLENTNEELNAMRKAVHLLYFHFSVKLLVVNIVQQMAAFFIFEVSA